jgi:hypothetical protein
MTAIISVTVNMSIFADHPDIDYDDDFMAEDKDYDLEYSEDSNSEPDVDLENQYYNSKSLKEL